MNQNYPFNAPKNKVLLLTFLFLTLRLIAAFSFGHHQIEGDSEDYNSYAQAILQNPDWLLSADFAGNQRPPGYPLFLACLYSIFGIGNTTAVFVMQAILSLLTCVLIGGMSQKLLGPKMGFLSFVISGFYGFYFYYLTFVLRETLVFFLLISFMFALHILLTRKTPLRLRDYLVPLVTYVLLIHVCSRYLVYLPFLWILFVSFRSINKGTQHYLVFFFGTFLLMAPWIIRNEIAYQGFVLIDTRCLDLRPIEKRDLTATGWMKNHVLNFKTLSTPREKDSYPTDDERQQILNGLNLKSRSAEEIKSIQKGIRPAATFLERKFFWLIELWRPCRFQGYYYPYPSCRFQYPWAPAHNLLSLVCYGTLLPFMFFGFVLLIREKNQAWIYLSFPILVQTGIHILQWGIWRYRVPIDAFIIIAASKGIFETWAYFSGRFKKSEKYS